jgi:hypothetical protein
MANSPALPGVSGGLSLEQYWDTSPNVDREEGLTLARLDDLVEVYLHFHDTELYEFATSVAVAFNQPKDLKKLEPKRHVELDMDALPAMLRIPKKRDPV